MAIHAKGKIVLFSEGEYSDFGYCGHVVTLDDCDFPALAQTFKADHRPKDEWDRPRPDGFVAWLCANQHVAEINADVLHIGSYGQLEIYA